MKELCFATNNPHKLKEVRHLVAQSYNIRSLSEIGFYQDIPEEEDTLEGNSLSKARYIFDKFKQPCFADDTGLEVTALGGEPGVYSARYAGDQATSNDNVKLLLNRMEKLQDRTAQFRTVITLIEDKDIFQFEGIIQGSISTVPSGKGGFGYDPVFVPAGYNQTFAEMPLDKKNLISHRALAIDKLVQFLLKK